MTVKLEKITKNFGKNDEINVLKGIDLEINDGEICVLLGPSGSGKSTLLNLIGGIDKPSSGSIKVGDQRIEQLKEKDLTKFRREKLGYIFQLYNLIPTLNVRENIESGYYLGKDPIDTDELLEVLGLTDQKNKRATELSGGQQQRTSIGRAIAKNPQILLCDEPTGALDYATSKEILKLLVDINKKYGTTVILVTHNGAFKNIADKVVELHDGKIRSIMQNHNKIEVEELNW